jgi:hypothetical protein
LQRQRPAGRERLGGLGFRNPSHDVENISDYSGGSINDGMRQGRQRQAA